MNEDFKACELAFGNGVSIVLHAASSHNEWYGNDFMPDQVTYAQHLADSLQTTNVHLCDDSFEEYLQREDLPQFDYICLHGIYSWVTEENRRFIDAFIAKHLKVGGVLYISYNSSPGFKPMGPMRHIINEYIKNLGSPCVPHNRQIGDCIKFIDKLVELKSGYTEQNERIKNTIETVFRGVHSDHNYLAHEYINMAWDIFHQEEVSKWLDCAKLTYICQVQFTDGIDRLSLMNTEMELLNRFKGTTFYRTLRDLMTNVQFHSDVFVKGVVRLDDQQFQDELDKINFVALKDSTKKDLTVKTRLGEAQGDRKLYQPILDIFADQEPHFFKEVRERLTPKGSTLTNTSPDEEAPAGLMNIHMLYEALVVLIAANALKIAYPTIDPEIVKRCQDYNRLVALGELRGIHHIVSPVTGEGTSLDDVSKIVISLRLLRPEATEQQILDSIFDIYLKNTDVKFTKKGKAVTDPKEIRKNIKEHVHLLLTDTFYNFKSLKIF